MSKKIVIFTVTGDQGSSVARYLLKDGGYEVVGIARNPESDKAKALEKAGVNIVKGDLADPDSYKPALKGVYGAFVNADFWTTYLSNGYDSTEAKQVEKTHATNAITAVAEAGVKHIVYSTLDKVGFVPHLDAKAETSEWAKEKGYPVTDFYTSHYISNLIKFGLLKKNEDGTLTITGPIVDDAPLLNYAVEQTGGWVTAIFNNPDKYIGKRVDACSESTTVKKWAEIVQEVTGKKTTTLGITSKSFLEEPEKYQTHSGEVYLNFKAFLEGKVIRDIEASKKVYPEQWDTKAWIENSEDFKKFLSS